MTIATYSPMQNLSRIFDSMLDYAGSEERAKTANPRSYLWENNGIYTLEVELPGVKKDDISVNVEANLLKIAAVRKRAEEEIKYEREYHLSGEIDTANIKASNDSGVLTLTLARKPEMQSKQVAIQ
jgi:HSP20 family protein